MKRGLGLKPILVHQDPNAEPCESLMSLSLGPSSQIRVKCPMWRTEIPLILERASCLLPWPPKAYFHLYT